MGTPPQSSTVPTLPQEPPANQGGLDTNTVNLFRQMMQAQDEQIRAQASQVQQLTDLVKNLALAGAQNAAQAASGSAPVTAEQAAAASPGDPSGPTPMDVDTGIRSRRAENYIPSLPQLNFASMTTRHAEIRVWSSYRDELTSWLCLLDDRFADELQEAEQSAVPVEQSKLDVGKAARSSKLWFLLKQSMSKFQRAQDLTRLIEIQQRGASAGYEFWRMLNKELSVRSRVEGQALREQALNLYPPKYLKRPLDVMRWYMTELMKYESQVTSRFPELKIHEQEAVLGVLKHLDEDAKRYLLLHQTTSGLDAMLRGLQFYDEQLRVLSFQKEHQHGGYLNAFGAGKGDNPKGKKGDKDKKGKGKGDGKDKKGKGKDGKDKPKGKDRGGGAASSSASRAKSKAKKTDVCHNCGGKGHWARDCPVKQASAVSHHEGSGATTGGAAGSSGNDAGNAASAAKAAPKPPSNQPTTKGNAEKGAGKGVRTFLEGAYFAMPSLALPFMQPEDKVYWLLDSGSSYHVVSKQTLETGHVKILSKRKMPKTVCQTATGDLVEVGSDTHATIEVNFLTTRPLEKQGDVLSTFACTCRLEAIVSDQIRHNLINLNLLCWKGWRPTLHEGLLTAEQKGITLYPHLYGDCTWLESVEPEHPSAMLASVSSHVGRSVGQSPRSVEKHEFLQHEQQEFLHEGHGFSRHEHEFSREPFVHEFSNMVGESAVAQLPSRVVELLQSGAVGQSGVAQLPSRVVELLQSSAVGEPCQEQHVCQDHRLCQDVSRTFLASPPATSSGPGPVQQGARCISEALHGMSSESLLGMSVGRSVGRAGGCTGEVDAVSQHVESSASCETPWPEHPSETSEVLGHHAPSQQVETGAAHRGGGHLRPTIEYHSVSHRVGGSGREEDTLLPSVPDPERGVVHDAALRPLAVGVPEVLSPVFQGGYVRSYDDRGAQPKHQRLEASRMSPGAHCGGSLYRQPEVGDGLASLPAELHEGTDPRDQGEDSSGGVVPLFGPVRGADPRRGERGGSDGGVIVSGSFDGSFELSGASHGVFDKARGHMDGAATASEVEARRFVDKAAATTSRRTTEEEGAGQDQWKALAGHIRCGSSVVGSAGECGATSPVDASECLTSEDKQLGFRRTVGSLEGNGGSPQGCIGESAAKDSTKVLGSFGGTRGSGYGGSGSKGATDATKTVGGTSYATTPDFGATSTTTTPNFRAASSATAPGISTTAPTTGGTWSPLRLDHSNISERRGDLFFPFGGELLYPGTARSGRGKGTSALGRGPAADSQCITERPAASCTSGAPFGSKGVCTGPGGCRDGTKGIGGDSRNIGEQLSDPRLWDSTPSATGSKDGFGPSAIEKQHASVGILSGIPSEISRPSALCAPPREHAKEASFESVSAGRCDYGAVAAPTMPLQDTSMFDEPNDLREAGRPGDPATEVTLDSTELAVDLGNTGADPIVAGESKKALDHRLRGHVPFWGSCEYCSRARGITPARKRQQGHPHEMQLDQCVYKHRFFVVLVHVATFAIAVSHRAEGTSGTEVADGLRDWCMHFGVSRERPHFLSDPEPLAISIAERLAENHSGTSEAFPAERHAPVAERAIRTLKGIVATLELELRENGVQLSDDAQTLEYLFRYAAHVHNRFSTSVGSTMSPFQKLRGHDHQPHLTYPFGAVVFAKVSKSSREEVDSKYARGVYLGPVLGSTGHLVHIRLDSGETKKVIAPGLKLLYPLRYDASLLEGATVPDGFLPPPDGDRFRELHLPYVPGGGPSKDWVDQHGKTPKCPGCSEAATSSRHSQRCVRRYQKWLRDSIDGTLEDLAQEPPPVVADESPPKRVRFGSPEIHDIPAPSLPSESDLEVPEIGLEPLDGTSEYEPSLPPEDEEDLMSDVAPEPSEKPPDRLPLRYLEELFGCTRFVRNGLSGCDAYDLEAFCNLLVGRSSVEKLSVELERGVDCVSVPVGRSVAACVSGGRSVDSVGWSVGSACSVGSFVPHDDTFSIKRFSSLLHFSALGALLKCF